MNRKILITIVFVFCLSLLTPSGYSEEIEREALNNGLVVITKTSRANDIVSVKLFLRCGSLYEEEDEAGISNIMQTLLQKGTTTRTATDIARESETIGAKLSSMAERDQGIVSLLTIRENLNKGLELFFDVIKNPTFPEKELEQEKAQALDNIKVRRDVPIRYAFDLFAENYYRKHPYHKPVLGYEETVSKLTRQDIVRFYKTHYVPQNMIIVAVGNFDNKTFIREVKKELGTLSGKKLAKDPLGISFSPPGDDKQILENRQSDAAWLVLGFGAPEISSGDYPTMKVINCITGGSMYSRLFTELRDKRGLGYQIGSLYRGRVGPAIYITYAGTKPEQFEIVREGILKEIQKLKEEPVGEDELKRAKSYIKGTFIMAQETNGGQAQLLGTFELAGLGCDFVKRYPQLIDSVTQREVQAASKKYFSNFTLAAVLPQPEEEEK